MDKIYNRWNEGSAEEMVFSIDVVAEDSLRTEGEGMP